MIALKQLVIPIASIDPIDDSAFAPGDVSAWIDAFAAQVRASRSAGIFLRARAIVALDVAQRMYEGQFFPEVGEYNSPLQLNQFGPEQERILLFVDVTLPDGTARLE